MEGWCACGFKPQLGHCPHHSLAISHARAWAQYRMGRDIMDHHFLGPRIMDKLVLSLIVMSLYYQVLLRS